MNPWLLEINLSPSLAFDSPLDLKIKGNLLRDTFNLIGVVKPHRRASYEEAYLPRNNKAADEILQEIRKMTDLSWKQRDYLTSFINSPVK